MTVKVNAAQVAQDLEDAYVYAYPLVLLDTVRDLVTNTEYPTTERAPLNQLFHSRELATSALTSLTRPNVDTLYSQAYIDLGDEPYLLFKPATDRYCTIQPFDGYSNTPTVLGTGAVGGNSETTYALTGPRFNGSLPDDVVPVAMPTDFVWLLLRIRCFGPHDVEEPHKIQDSLDLYPLSQYGGVHTYPQGNYTPDNDYLPVDHIQKMSIQEYFNRFNELGINNPGSAEDKPSLERFAQVGLGAGLKFDRESLPEAARDRADELPGLMSGDTVHKNRRITKVAGWTYLDKSVGRFGTNYLYRAAIAHGGFANPVEITAYPSTRVDSSGEPLTGSKSYKLHFEPGQLPPHLDGGWWSITAYTSLGKLIENELDRYAIGNDQQPLMNTDDSLDIWISAENPGPDRERNWLPVGPEEFGITIRIYLPEDSVTEHDWTPPQFTELSGVPK